jgi:hypothetical protein
MLADHASHWRIQALEALIDHTLKAIVAELYKDP